MRKFIFLFLCVLFYGQVAIAATRYVDGSLPAGDCTTGNYSIANRTCTGTAGNAYDTVAEGLAATGSGDTLYIRAGTYTIASEITWGGNFASMATISGYESESVILSSVNKITNTITLNSSTNNVTFTKLNFLGSQYFLSKDMSLVNISGNVYKETSEAIFNTYIGSPSTSWAEGALLYNGPTEVDCATAVQAGNDGDFGYWGYHTCFKSTSDPTVRTDLALGAGGHSLGNDSSGTGYVIVDNCTFDGKGHTHLKGGFRWWVKNCTFKNVSANDANDHHIYAFGKHTVGNEAIYEHNYFEGPWAGAAIHVYKNTAPDYPDGPDYHIIRYNIMKGVNSGAYHDQWGVLLDASYSKVYNNVIDMAGSAGAYGSTCISVQGQKYNEIKNNILLNGGYSGGVTLLFEGTSTNHVVQNNLTDYSSAYSGTCTSCTVSNNLVSKSDLQFVSTSPSNWYDFRLKETSDAINAGINIGSPHDQALDPTDTTWPPSTVDQDSYGNWEIGAFAYGATPPTTTTTTTTTTTITTTTTTTTTTTLAANQYGRSFSTTGGRIQ